jgi:hypothetical protein
VERNYERKLETLDEILSSDVVYGSNPFLSFSQDTFSYPELLKCFERMIGKRGIASFIAPFFANYVPRDLGNVDFGKIIRSLNEA